MDFFSSAKRNGKRNENPDGKKSGHLQVFFWWKLSRWKKKPGRSKDFFPLKKEMISFQKEMEKEMKILMGKNLDIFKFFFGGNYPGGKKTWKI